MRHQESERNPYTSPVAPTVGEEPPRWRRWWKIVIVLGAVVAVGYLGNAFVQGLHERVFPGAALSGRSTSMDLVNLELVDKEAGKTLRLRVPKAYLIDVKNWSGGAQRRVSLSARLPTMQPAALTDAKNDPGSGMPDEEEVLMVLENVHADDGYMERRYQAERRRYNKPQGEIFGLEHYLGEVCDPRTGECRLDLGELFTSQTAGARRERVILLCERPDIYPGASCVVRMRFNEFAVRYSFKRVKLAQWQTIHEAVLQLLAGFASR